MRYRSGSQKNKVYNDRHLLDFKSSTWRSLFLCHLLH